MPFLNRFPWTCGDCLELARNSRAKGKCGIVKQNRNVQMIKSQFDKELEDMRARMKSLEDTVSKLMSVSNCDTTSAEWPKIVSHPIAIRNFDSTQSTTHRRGSEVDFLSAVHTEMLAKTRRKSNIVVQGLAAAVGLTEVELFQRLCTERL